MLLCFRRLLVAVLVIAMMMTLTGSALAAPNFRDRPLTTRPNPGVVMRGSGWGHGIGMSQYGAYAMSRAGKSYGAILRHYYTGIALQKRTMPAVRVDLSQGTFFNVDAISGRIPWRAKIDGSWRTKWQAKATTWNVKRDSAGRFVLRQGGTVKWRVAASRLVAPFNWAAKADGTIIEAFNPNVHRRPDGTYEQRSYYKWGRLAFNKASSLSGINLDLEIPSMDLYLRGLAEVPDSWASNGGMAALKAQAVAGRSYARYQLAGGGIAATTSDQYYIGYDHERSAPRWVDAVKATAGIVATHDGNVINALYSSSHGGRSENVEDVFYTALPYLRSVADPWSLGTVNPYRAWSATTSNASFASFASNLAAGTVAKVRRVEVRGRTAGGTPKTLRVTGLRRDGSPIATSVTNSRGIVGLSVKPQFGLRSAQLRRFGFAPFTDDDGGRYEYASLFAHRARIMNDATIPRFRPGKVVTRARGAMYLNRLLTLPTPTRDYFSDDDGLPEEGAINRLAEAGIVSGRRFRPGDPFTRANAAVVFRNALGLSKSDTQKDYFTDDEGSRAEPAINRMKRRGLMGGCGGTKFCPLRAMRRGPMASLLLRVVEEYR